MSDLHKRDERAPTDGSPPAVTLRPVEPDDEPFLFIVYASTRMAELAQVPWDEAQREAFLRMQFEAQQYHYRKHYPDASHEIILLKGEPIGRVYVAREEQAITILDITLVPEHRSCGLGTPLIKDLQSEAARAGKALHIYVENFNPSLRLFERLGFSGIGDDGVNILMEWRAGDVESQGRE